MKFEVLYRKTFLKDLRKLPKDIRIKVEQLSFDILPETENLSDIKGLEKLVSHEFALEQVDEAMRTAMSPDSMKVVIRPNGG